MAIAIATVMPTISSNSSPKPALKSLVFCFTTVSLSLSRYESSTENVSNQSRSALMYTIVVVFCENDDGPINELTHLSLLHMMNSVVPAPLF